MGRTRPEVEAEATRLRREENWSTPRIARHLGVSPNTVYRIVAGYPWRKPDNYGARAEWSLAEIEELYKLYPTSPRSVVEAALPRRKWNNIVQKAVNLDIRRLINERRRNFRPVHPVIAELRAARLRQNLTVRTVAERSGYHPQHITNIEIGNYANPGFRLIADLAAALGLDIRLVAKNQPSDKIGQFISPPDPKRLMAGRA